MLPGEVGQLAGGLRGVGIGRRCDCLESAAVTAMDAPRDRSERVESAARIVSTGERGVSGELMSADLVVETVEVIAAVGRPVGEGAPEVIAFIAERVEAAAAALIDGELLRA